MSVYAAWWGLLGTVAFVAGAPFVAAALYERVLEHGSLRAWWRARRRRALEARLDRLEMEALDIADELVGMNSEVPEDWAPSEPPQAAAASSPRACPARYHRPAPEHLCPHPTFCHDGCQAPFGKAPAVEIERNGYWVPGVR